jgi:23S rRNA pseudouridine1911/1915/1917 synthase
VLKPAGMLTAGDRTGDVSLLELARQYLKAKYKKPGNVYLGLVHRLDRPVSGVVLFARTSKAAARLSEQFRDGTVRKVYEAWVEGRPAQSSGTLTDFLIKDKQRNVVSAARPEAAGARQAILKFRALAAEPGRTLLEIHPQTGRAHQIRVQLASRGTPIVGDVKYSAKRDRAGSIALNAAELTFQHPVRKESITIRAPRPE